MTGREFYDALFDREAWRRLGGRIFWWLLISGVAGIFTGATTFYYRVEIFDFLIAPAGGRLSPFEGGLPVVTSPLGALSATFGLAGKGFFVGFFTMALWGVYSLFTPVMSPRYRRAYKIFAPVSTALFVAGAAFAYYVIMARLMSFVLGSRFVDGIAVPLIELGEYMGLMVRMAITMGLVFQIPLIMFFLGKNNVLHYQQVKRRRKRILIFAMVLAGIITPTFDVLNWLIMMIPVYSVFELGLFLMWLTHPDEGNYLFMRSLWHAVIWLPMRPVHAYRKISGWLM